MPPSKPSPSDSNALTKGRLAALNAATRLHAQPVHTPQWYSYTGNAVQIVGRQASGWAKLVRNDPLAADIEGIIQQGN